MEKAEDLEMAVLNGDLTKMESLSQETDLNIRDKHGNTILHKAVNKLSQDGFENYFSEFMTLHSCYEMGG